MEVDLKLTDGLVGLLGAPESPTAELSTGPEAAKRTGIGPLSIHDTPAIVAKGKGCSTNVAMASADELTPVFFAGVGFSSHAETPEAIKPAEETLAQDTLAAEWVSNRMLGTHPELGEMRVRFHTQRDDGRRSSAVVIGEEPGSLLPGTFVNSLFVDVELVDLGLTLVNRDPLVLRSRSENLSPEHIRADVRFQRDPGALPRAVRQVLADTTSAPRFLPVGVHRQQQKLNLYAKDNPDQVVAYMVGGEVKVVPHYGLELDLVASDVHDDILRTTMRVTNLTDRPLTVHVYTEAHGNLDVASTVDIRRLDLEPRGTSGERRSFEVAAQVRPGVTNLGPLDCLFVGASNLATDMADFVSAAAVLVSSSDETPARR